MSIHDPDSTTKDRKTKVKSLVEGQELFVLGQDGSLIFGIVVEIDRAVDQVLVRFGDCTEKWSSYLELKTLETDEIESQTSKYKNYGHEDDEEEEEEEYEDNEKENEEETETEVKENSFQKKDPRRNKRTKRRRGIHQVQCQQQQQQIEKYLLSESRPPTHVLEARKELSYDFSSLIWDELHQRNVQERYCYCGESGDWYRKMLQCDKCLQWFHQDCIRTLYTNLLLGDSFWNFVCTLCTGRREERIQRNDMSWRDVVHLSLFNLTILHNNQYHDIETSLVPFIRSKWKYLIGPNALLLKSKATPTYIESLLKSDKFLFKCGGSDTKCSKLPRRSNYWGLRKVAPPSSSSPSSMSISSSVDVLFEGSNHGKKRRSSLLSKVAKQQNEIMEDFNGGRRFKFGNLDSFIPVPSNFEGLNHPFIYHKDHDDNEESNGGKKEREFFRNSAETRISRGEGFKVSARRLTLDGNVQYLIDWNFD